MTLRTTLSFFMKMLQAKSGVLVLFFNSQEIQIILKNSHNMKHSLEPYQEF